IKRRLNSGNDCYHPIQKLLSSRLLPKNIKIRIHKTIILPVVLYGCEEIGWDGMDWIDLAQDRDQWRALVNKVMNLLAP
ncbi:hypothetical protein B7P43_G07331, partial [Cryptotermes secundus]